MLNYARTEFEHQEVLQLQLPRSRGLHHLAEWNLSQTADTKSCDPVPIINTMQKETHHIETVGTVGVLEVCWRACTENVCGHVEVRNDRRSVTYR